MAAAAVAAAEPSTVDGFRSVGNVFTYVTSRWAVLCLFMTVILNRTMIYAALRRPVRLPFEVRVLIRIVPIVLFGYHITQLLFVMRCQSSVVFTGENRAVRETTEPFFRAVGSVGSWWMDDRAVCESIGMIPNNDWIDRASTVQNTDDPEIDLQPPRGSLEYLWPLYKSLSLSQFLEVFSCAVTGRVPAAETGMTLLEHSLAFAEAEALAIRKTYRLETAVSLDDDGNGEVKILKVKGEKIVPAEVLYIALLSSLGHFTSHIMAIFNWQSKYRLISTSVFGLAFMAGFVLSIIKGGVVGILDFPTVTVVGFIPHLLILSGIVTCAFIYGLALIFSSMFPPSGRRGFNEGFANLRANLTLSSVSISASEDFYTVLLKLGFMCLTAASKATYLNEGRAVRVPSWTWLEGEHSKYLESQRSVLGKDKPGSYLPTGTGLGPYAKERKDLTGIIADTTGKDARRSGGAGHWIGAGELLRGVGVVLGRWGLRSTARLFNTPSAALPPAPGALADERQLRDELDSATDDDGVSYTHFLLGDALPDTDASSDFAPSVVDSDSDSDADSTPTSTPRPHSRSRHATPAPDGAALTDLFATPHALASLLDPATAEDRAAARLLARHLTAPHALTRCAYEASLPALSGATEASALEGMLVTRRRAAADDVAGAGPVCVVCQTAPRTIIVWPCRCLSLCEDCRVGLAMNNFANCVTCRQKSEGFSRIYIP
ncbi:hypothetical protein EDC01DRAFT_610213 [Geopyxis carbonaria]|nr:hypothetical protein EDC01DRAFT_610213 [Geopyxis carbonaria]